MLVCAGASSSEGVCVCVRACVRACVLLLLLLLLCVCVCKFAQKSVYGKDFALYKYYNY